MFDPILPLSGVGGWRFLQQTYDSQFEAFTQSVELQREADYFRENIGNVSSADELVSDYRLLSVALSAFSLEDDIDSKFFIQKILQEGTVSDDALATKLSDSHYTEFAQAFGFGPGETLQLSDPAFIDTILDRYEAVEFEIATGEQDETMQNALYAERLMGDLASSDISSNSKWYTVMGDTQLRTLFETAFNLPSEFAQIDIDQQLGVFKERAQKEFGTDDLSIFSDPEILQDLVTKYVARDQVANMNGSYSSNSIALSLLGVG